MRVREDASARGHADVHGINDRFRCRSSVGFRLLVAVVLVVFSQSLSPA